MASSLLVTLLTILGQTGPFHDLSFDQACAKAKTDGKVVMLDFFTTWCPPCRDLDRITWKNEEVERWLAAKTVAVKVDAEKERALAERFQVKAYPTLVLVNPDGSVLGRMVGYRNPKVFLEDADGILRGVEPKDADDRKPDPEHDPMLRETLALELQMQGKRAEALEQLIWCWDHGLEWNEHYSAVRHSFLVGKFAGLARVHPPAMAALRERRERAAHAVLSPAGTSEDADDVCAIDEALGEKEKSLALYDELGRREEPNAKVRRALFREVMALLLQQKRYRDFIDNEPDIPRAVQFSIECYNDVAGERLLGADAYIRASELEEGGMYYEALLGTGRIEEAKDVSRLLIRFEWTSDTFLMLARHAWRAGTKEIAQELLERTLIAANTGAQRAHILKEWRRYLEGDQSWLPWR